jgi:hypothetical protein
MLARSMACSTAPRGMFIFSIITYLASAGSEGSAVVDVGGGGGGGARSSSSSECVAMVGD